MDYDSRTTRCPACNTNQTEIIEKTDNNTFVIYCQNCESSFRFPFIDVQKTSDFYEKRSIKTRRKSKLHWIARNKVTKKRMAFLLDALNQSQMDFHNLVFVDIGAGLGLQVHEAQKAGFYKSFGLEPQPWCIEFAQENYGINLTPKIATRDSLVAILDNIPENISVVLFVSHVLEHIADINSFIKTLSSVTTCERTVFLYLEVPHTEMEILNCNSLVSTLFWYQHITSFSKQGIRFLLERNRWQVTKIDTPSNSLRAPARFRLLRAYSRKNKIRIYTTAAINRIMNILGSVFGGDCHIDIPKVIRVIAKIDNMNAT